MKVKFLVILVEELISEEQFMQVWYNWSLQDRLGQINSK